MELISIRNCWTAQADPRYFEVSFSVPSHLSYDFLYDFDVTPTLQTADCTLSSLNHGVGPIIPGLRAPPFFRVAGTRYLTPFM